MALQGLEGLLSDVGVECDIGRIQQVFQRFDSSAPLFRDGTLFIDDFARFFHAGRGCSFWGLCSRQQRP